jgi:hypothetical protein
MKVRSILVLVGLAITFALSTFAQEAKTPDPQLREKLIAPLKDIPMRSTKTMQPRYAQLVALNPFVID